MTGLVVIVICLWPDCATAHCSTYDNFMVAPGWALFAFMAIIILETALIRRVLKLPYKVALSAMLRVNLVSFIVPYALAVLGLPEMSLMYMPLESMISRYVSAYPFFDTGFAGAVLLAVLSVGLYTLVRLAIESSLTAKFLQGYRSDMTWGRVVGPVVLANFLAIVIFFLIFMLAVPFNPPGYYATKIGSNVPDNGIVRDDLIVK